MNNPKQKPPYPWPRAIMLQRYDAKRIYALEAQRETLRSQLIDALGDHIEGGEWSHIYPYLLFCELEGVSPESSIAAALGYLRHVVEGDLQHDTARESLKGLVLPKEPS